MNLATLPSLFAIDTQEIVKDYVIPYGMNVAFVLVVLFLALIVAGWLQSMAAKGMRKAKVDETLTRFLSKMVRWLVLLLAFIACMGLFGIPTTSFAAVLGAAGLAVGLAFQGTLGNFAAGMMLLLFRPFKVGDAVNVAGQLGKVDAIELFSTTLDTFDNRRLIIPNGAIFGSTIENISHHPIRRADVAVGVGYAADVDRTREVLEEAAKNVPGALSDPAPAIVLLELGGSSVDWSVRVWTNSADFGAVKQATTRAVKLALDEAGIDIPFPQMDVHVMQAAAV